MKIGIVTIYHANMGSYFQATALLNYLKDKGYDCELVNASVRGKHMARYYMSEIGRKFLNKKILEKIEKKVPAFEINNSIHKDLENLPVSPFTFGLKKIQKRYDCVLIGSDEVWSSTLPNVRFIPAYFGIGIDDGKPLFSYASSGVSLKNPGAKEKAIMDRQWKRMDYIAVRDTVTQSIVEEVTGNKVPLVLDPTMLNPFFLEKRTEVKNQMLVYGVHFSEEQVNAIKAYAKKNSYQLVSLSWRHDWCEKHIKAESAQDMERAFAESCYCISSTFHGTVFSILNNKPFTCFAADFRAQKIYELLEKFDLLNCIYNSKTGEGFGVKIDYEEVNRKLQNLQCESKEYLDRVLEKLSQGE